jgi:hypothetical protein
MNLKLSTIHYFLLTAIIAVVFTNTIIGCQFLFDDEHFILKNLFHSSWSYFPKYFTENMVAGAGIESNLYRPLELLTHGIDLSIWGRYAPGHKITNVLIYICMILSLYKVFVRMVSAQAVADAARNSGRFPL